jgi:MFS family permease
MAANREKQIPAAADEAHVIPTASGAALATRPFLLLCLTMFLGCSSHWVLMPTIPLYVQDLGGSAFTAGLVLLAFAIPSFTMRPLLGNIADRWSAAGVLAVGLAFLAAGSLLLFVAMLTMLFVGIIVRGVGWSGFYAGGYATLATAAPPHRRGEAAGYYSAATTSATLAMPAIGLWLINGPGGVRAVFAVSAVLALAAIPVARHRMQRSPPNKQPAAATGAARTSVIERGVLLATGLNLCASLVAPAVMAFLPLYARTLGIENIGLFYVLAGATNIVIRPLLGKKSDAVGRGPAIAAGLLSQLIGLMLIITAQDLTLILVSALFFATGQSLIGSTTTALAMDLANPRSRGRAMASYSISYQIGAGAGAIISGALADWIGMRGMYLGCVAITLAGFIVLASTWKAMPRPQR